MAHQCAKNDWHHLLDGWQNIQDAISLQTLWSGAQILLRTMVLKLQTGRLLREGSIEVDSLVKLAMLLQCVIEKHI